jgi:pyruvate formate lyase activating enzyme
MIGRVHSFQSLGTLDGPGVRFVVFAQGCPLRCACCHNPDTWDRNGGLEISAQEIVGKVVRYREYFGKDGGVTFSGGEPLLQPDFVRETFVLCQNEGIHTCLDTSGFALNDAIKAALAVTDRVLLDIKYTEAAHYEQYVGCAYEKVREFLNYLNEQKIPTTLRQVILPGINDTAQNVRALAALRDAHPCVDGIELLPFKKMCQVKYDQMGIDFPFADVSTPTKEQMEHLQQYL